MNIKRFREIGAINTIEEVEDGKYCLYSEYYFLKKEYDQLKKEHTLAIDKLHEYRHMIKALTER